MTSTEYAGLKTVTGLLQCGCLVETTLLTVPIYELQQGCLGQGSEQPAAWLAQGCHRVSLSLNWQYHDRAVTGLLLGRNNLANCANLRAATGL